VPLLFGTFFLYSWFNGPLSAVILDVVPAAVRASVLGAYVLFSHLAGDAIAPRSSDILSDRFGLRRQPGGRARNAECGTANERAEALPHGLLFAVPRSAFRVPPVGRRMAPSRTGRTDIDERRAMASPARCENST